MLAVNLAINGDIADHINRAAKALEVITDCHDFVAIVLTRPRCCLSYCQGFAAIHTVGMMWLLSTHDVAAVFLSVMVA
jgi:hypothetical protein